jgi:hypothetical protein
MTPSRDEILDLIVRWEEARARGQADAPGELCRDRTGECANPPGLRRVCHRLPDGS